MGPALPATVVEDVAPIALGSATPADGTVLIVIEATGGACAVFDAVARGGRVEGGLLDRALATWLAVDHPLTVAGTSVPPCDGLPGVDGLLVSSGGRLVGLRTPGTRAEVAGNVSATPVGPDGGWWYVTAAGDGALVVWPEDPADPPVRFSVRASDEAPILLTEHLAVPRDAAALVDCARTVSYAGPAEGAARAEAIGAHSAVVVGQAAGASDVIVRCDADPPRVWTVEVGAPRGPSPHDLVVGLGKARSFAVDGPVRRVFTAAPGVASAERRGARIRVEGRAPGRTDLVVELDDGRVFVVPVAVGT